LSITRTTTRGEEHDFQSCTSRRSFEGLPGRHHRCRSLKAFTCDPSASFADSKRKGGYFCFHVLASFSRAAHIARFLAKDADTVRSLAGAAKEATQDTAVSKSGAVGLAARRGRKGLERVGWVRDRNLDAAWARRLDSLLKRLDPPLFAFCSPHPGS
jgi:hypothetical protein